ncbi:MAG: hypothetical protein CMQ40_10855 [Gammaproteobacteria bacterium]|nr:hypothetical protein [Gammaproteobacteria bacterium]
MPRAKSERPPATWKVRKVRDIDPEALVLVPSDDESLSRIRSYKEGDELAADIRKPRNVGHHRKFWKLLEIVRHNCEGFDSEENVLYALKAALGRGQWVKVPKASRPLFVPESISFASMDQEEFSAFYSDAVNAVLKHWIPADREDLEQAIALDF